MIPSILRCALLLVGSLCAFVSAQQPGSTKDDDAVVKEGPKDPFTGGDEKLMQALGVVSYAPLPWADNLRTTDIEKVLGEGRVLWLETAHFRIGCNLGLTALPQEPAARKLVNAELQQLNKRCNKLPSRASKLGAWLRLHLYALRAETLYADYAELIGFDAAAGTHLGQKDKFLILLFQKKSDLSRYLDRFCGMPGTVSQRYRHPISSQEAIVMTGEGDDGPRDEASVYAQFRFLLVQSLQDAAGSTPYWLSLGIAHWYERQVPCNMMNAAPRADESVDQESQNKWPAKVKGRIQHDALLIPFTKLTTMTDFGYFAHTQVWSRVDWWMQQDRAKFGQFVRGLLADGSAARQLAVLLEVYGQEPEACDAAWRRWVMANYK